MGVSVITLAGDAPRRERLRERLLGSKLLDHAGFTRKLEAAYRGVWQAWCSAQAQGAVSP
jgi:hypothetical protein